ncbi:multimeric flavodoxin WrbA [Sporomusaceae bacterium BoRhaA]|uniref:flavodoxin family protein n=1 Tax=Pelorhabdus rhamnosifermentans TaxID=2772457 RepID=UPI001C05F668|nr:flavodoxin family protein [Pelorhabdus rhamnosifermentans]MBU2699995.1 multimeric flavodoxin WrbA [Pelorhabdus rhamnosifermentans]
MKKVIAINGSPRKKWNTATLLNKALEGAASQGAETELINLYDLNYKGCISCFACKLKDGKSYGKCACRDDLTLILEKIEQADALILGSPIYLGAATGEMRSFIERLIFPYLVYDENYSTLFNKKIPTGFIYTMNVNESQMKEMGYNYHLQTIEWAMKRIFGSSESLFVTDTYQFDDYSKYVATKFNSEEKAKRRQEEFPRDCKKAFEMGARFVTEVKR